MKFCEPNRKSNAEVVGSPVERKKGPYIQADESLRKLMTSKWQTDELE